METQRNNREVLAVVECIVRAEERKIERLPIIDLTSPKMSDVRQRATKAAKTPPTSPATAELPEKAVPKPRKTPQTSVSSIILIGSIVPMLLATSFLTTKTLTFGVDPHALARQILPVTVVDKIADVFHPKVPPKAVDANLGKATGGSNAGEKKKKKKKKKVLTVPRASCAAFLLILPFCDVIVLQPQPRVFTTAELKEFDGSDPSKPIYVAISGKVYDVSAGQKHYGKGGGYSFFAGVDATRAYITGCFQTHLTHDLRGLSEEQLKTDLTHWIDFYEKHEKYFYVGEVKHDPIPDDQPIPEPCT
ncbi:hypothetical protein HDU84_002674 [Entophlyctis sp. JEL0112]|nr:hypothetical protein HDU84_002674 [Entophlyctis sp. JEL0112]